MSRWVYVYDDPSLLSSRAHYGLLLVSKFVSIELSNCKYKYSLLVIHSHLIWVHYEKGGSGFSCFWANQGSTWKWGRRGISLSSAHLRVAPHSSKLVGHARGQRKEKSISLSSAHLHVATYLSKIGGNPVWTKQESISEKRVRVGLSHDNDRSM